MLRSALCLTALVPVACGSSDDGAPADSVIGVDVGVDVGADVPGDGESERACSSPAIACAEGDEVLPGTTLHCSASAQSSAVYRWSLSQPSGSFEVVRPSATARDIEVALGTIGTYTLVLETWDDGGVSCGSAEYDVVVTTDEAIRIELVWSAPGDPGDSGASGADLDLHVLHPDADGFFDPRYDVHWANPSPSWGEPGDAPSARTPNPGVDDIEGAGVEMFVLHLPELQHTYTAGVHYWDDHGLGLAFATLRVYVHGQLRFSSPAVELVAGDLWEVVEIDWPTGAARAIGGDTPRITADYPVSVTKD